MSMYQQPGAGGSSPMMSTVGLAQRGGLPVNGPMMAQRGAPMGGSNRLGGPGSDRHGFDEYDDVDMSHGYDRGNYRY